MPLLVLLLLGGCCVNPFHNTRSGERGRPADPEVEARRPIAPAQPAVQATGGTNDEPGAGFDLRLVQVQPGAHLNTEQPCDVFLRTEPAAVAGDEAGRYSVDAAHHMAVRCHAPAGNSWADLIFSPEHASAVQEIRRGSRVRVRILTSDGGEHDYPIVQFVEIEGYDPALAESDLHAQPSSVPNGFNLRRLADEPGLIGTTQQCAVARTEPVDLLRPDDRRERNYPAGIQNRMTVTCKHANGEEHADLVFMPAQALAALSVRRGEVVPVRIISRNGGFTDYPILQFAGQ